MTLEEQNKILKTLVIFLAGCYQKNFDNFASSQNYSSEVKEVVGEEIYEQIFNIFTNFSTVQGSSMRDLVEELASLPVPKEKVPLEEIRNMFGYTREEKRKELYNKKYSDEAKKANIERIKKLWRVET